ncbi:MAG: 50S ribosomal protein L9 [Coriobacteriia bacterium]|nr:50S ribosomal protein L9 [Coriobacteriia bacterium]
MKVILTQDVKGRGQEGDVIDVARGFAVNFLMPRKIAIEATSGNIKQLEARMGNIKKRESVRRGDAESIAAAVEGKKVIVTAKAGDGGKLYGSITSAMIADAVSEQLGVEVDRRKLDVHAHIKTLGEHEVQLNVYYDVKANLTVKVVADGTVEAPVEEPVVEVVEIVEVEESPVAEEAEEAAEDVDERE